MKRFYLLSNPYDEEFTRAGRRGTWKPALAPPPCAKCGTSFQKRVSPLIIEWEKDRTKRADKVLGDFTWPGFLDDLLVTDRVKKDCEGRFQGIEFKKVQYVNDSKGPIHGPLWDLIVTKVYNLDVNKSSLEIESQCDLCNRVFYKDFSLGKLIAMVDVDVVDFFRLHEFESWRFVTEEVMLFMREMVYTNVAFVESGVIRQATG